MNSQFIVKNSSDKEIRIVELSSILEKEYFDFLIKRDNISIYHSLIYRDLLAYCTRSTPKYFIAINESEKIVGCLPSFFKQDEILGNVLNSLPFFGSHGGLICNDSYVGIELLKYYDKFARENNCLSYTINSNLNDNFIDIYISVLNPSTTLKKVSQITLLPPKDINLKEILFSKFHQKTRNIIRKSLSYGFEILVQNDKESFESLEAIHKENMISKGLLPKPSDFFNYIQKKWIPGVDYNIYVAKKNDKIVSALLLLYFNKTVEYYCPATKLEYRNKNPLSLLIYFSMIDAAFRGYKYWNWGSSGNQKSVYDFKKKWGTLDIEYYTFCKILNNSLLNVNQSTIINHFTYFFVYPFSKVI